MLTRIHSRTDAYFGNNHVFNQSVFDRTKAYWTDPVLTIEMVANSKLFRQVESKAYNANYTFTTKTNEAALLEAAAPFLAFGDAVAGTARRDFVEYFFGEWDTLHSPASSLLDVCLTPCRE